MGNFLAVYEKKYPYTKNCEELLRQIDALIVERAFMRNNFRSDEAVAVENVLAAKKKWFEIFGCEVYLSSKKSEVVGNLIEAYQQTDKERIKKQSNSDIIIRIIFGIFTIAVITAMVYKKSKK